MRKGLVLLIVLGVCAVWLAVPFTASAWVEKHLQGKEAEAATKGGTVQWGESKTITPTATVTIEWKEGRPTPLSAERRGKAEDVLDCVHRYEPRKPMTQADKTMMASVAPPIGPATQRDPSMRLPEDFSFIINDQLNSSEAVSTSNVMEPVAMGVQMKRVFMTGNWFAARSQDHGRNWTHVDPYTVFDPETGYEFCCDQEIFFDTVHNIYYWSMLYVNSGVTGGYWRLAVSKNLNTWTLYDFSKEADGDDDTTIPDFPHMAVTHNFLYVTWNEYAGGSFDHVNLMRIHTAEFLLLSGTWYQEIALSDIFTLKVAHNNQHHSTMYAATNHITGADPFNQVRVYAWEEWSNTITYQDITVAGWNYTTPYTCTCQDGYNVCGRLDDRVLGVIAMRNDNFPEDCADQLWISWTSNSHGSYTYPYTYIVKLCIHGDGALSDWDVAGYMHQWNASTAIIYAAMYPNPRGDVYMVADWAGGTGNYTSFDALIIDEYNGYTGPYTWEIAATGDACPSDEKWGDYNYVEDFFRNSLNAVASGHVILSGRSTPVYIRFCRERDFAD
jgi:hypothetical protein